MKNFDAKGLVKWIPVVVAAVAATIQAIGDKTESERIDDMEKRINQLEEGEEA